MQINALSLISSFLSLSFCVVFFLTTKFFFTSERLAGAHFSLERFRVSSWSAADLALIRCVTSFINGRKCRKVSPKSLPQDRQGEIYSIGKSSTVRPIIRTALSLLIAIRTKRRRKATDSLFLACLIQLFNSRVSLLTRIPRVQTLARHQSLRLSLSLLFSSFFNCLFTRWCIWPVCKDCKSSIWNSTLWEDVQYCIRKYKALRCDTFRWDMPCTKLSNWTNCVQIRSVGMSRYQTALYFIVWNAFTIVLMKFNL